MTVIAHVGGIPVEETLGMYGPALLLVVGAASASVGARLRRLRRAPHATAPPATPSEARRIRCIDVGGGKW
jgi:hypothetical protein